MSYRQGRTGNIPITEKFLRDRLVFGRAAVWHLGRGAGGAFWPQWLARDIPGLAAWTLAYDAPPTNWLGTAMPIPAESAGYATARECYLAQLPSAAPLFDFPDFALFRFVPSEARYIGGFARIYTLTRAHLNQAARLLATENTEI